MSDRPSLRLTRLPRVGVITATLVGSLAFGGGSFVAVAQDASPSPMGDCVPGTPDTSMATPVASPVADETAAEPVGIPADEAAAEAANAFVENAKACTADPEGLSTLVTANFVHSLGGYDSVEAAKADGFFEDAPFANATTGEVTSYDDGRVGIVVDYQQTEYQFVSEEWLLVDVNGELKLDGINPGLPVELDGDSAAVGINLLENGDGTYAISPNAESVVATDVLILQGVSPATNVEPHMLVVLKLPEGADPMGLMDGSIADEDVEFIGVVDGILPGDSTDMYLFDLPAGVYTLACFVNGPDGAPHAANGMVVQFEVTAPEEVATPTS
jgi:hypothetical protein